MVLSNNCYVTTGCKKFDVGKCPNEDFCMRLFKIDYYLTQATLTDKQKQPIKLISSPMDDVAFKRLYNIENDIENFVNSGAGLFIFSSTPGNGKTSWSINLLKAYIESVWYKSPMCCKALFVNVPRFLLALKESISSLNEYADHVKQNIIDADLVVWDEIGNKIATEYEKEQLLNFINTRIDFGKANIYTSNIHPAMLSDFVGDRLQSRINNASTKIEMRGFDRRAVVIDY